MKKILYRIYQFIMRIAMYFIPYRKPYVLKGQKATEEIVEILSTLGHKTVLIVTDKGVISHGICNDLFSNLQNQKIKMVVFDGTVANPTIDNIEEGLKLYNETKCSCIIAIGGGSPIDCAKMIGARVAHPNKSISKMRGILKLRHNIPPLIVFPTTAGTGSETTLAAIVTNPKTHEKYAVNDPHLIPNFAILDPDLTVSLPPLLTATTGIDALTHAIEAYIGNSNTHETRLYSQRAIKIIFENIEKAYSDGTDITARQNMQEAAYYAGLAFTRAYVGNVHAIAHTLGGQYSVPHGLANAVILPIVLSYYKENIYSKIGRLCRSINIFEDTLSDKELTEKFIQKLKSLNQSFGIPKVIPELIKQDIPKLITRAYHEANPLYPVPQIFEYSDFFNIYSSLLAN